MLHVRNTLLVQKHSLHRRADNTRAEGLRGAGSAEPRCPFWKVNMCASGRCLRYVFCWLLKEEQGRLETAILEYVIFQGSSLSP